MLTLRHTMLKRQLGPLVSALACLCAWVPSIAMAHGGHGHDDTAHLHAWDIGSLGLLAVVLGGAVLVWNRNRRK
jgi:hypothetical protein